MTKKIGVKVSGIKWDTDGEDVVLPKTVNLRVRDLEKYLDLNDAADDEVADTIGDILTKKYEFCHNGFKWNWLRKKMTLAQANRAKVDTKVRRFLKRIRAKLEKAVKHGEAEPIDESEWQKLEVLVYKLAK